MNRVMRLVMRDEGQDLIEYALLAGFIAVAVAAAVASLGGGVQQLFWPQLGTQINNAAAS
jgi:Flp pilus assembly pilin Flp